MTALTLLVAALAFWLESPSPSPVAHGGLARVTLRNVSALAVGLVGLGVLLARSESALASAVLAREFLSMNFPGRPPGLPSTLTGLAFTLLAAASALRGRVDVARGLFLHGALSIALFALIGMLLIATIPDSSIFHQLAFPTAVALALLALGGLLADPEQGVVGALRRPGPAALYLRASLLTALLVPTALGWVRVYLHREYALPVEAGISLFAVSIIIAFAVVAVLTARTVERLDAGASALLQAAPEAMLVVDAGGIIRRANAQAEHLLRVSATSLLGSPVDRLLPPDLRATHAGHRHSFVASDGPRPMGPDRAVTAQRWDGTQFRAEVTLSPLRSGEGQFVIAVLADVTERDEAQRVLYESEARFRETFANAAVGVALVGLAGEWLQVNQYYCQVLGYTEAELRALTFADVTHPEDLQADLDLLRQLTAGEIPRYELDKRYIQKSGRVVFVRLGASAVRAPDGTLLYYIAIVQDVTESRKAQATLAETVLLQEAILQSTNLSIISTDANGVITTFNRGAEQMLGYRADEVVGQLTAQALHDAAELEARAGELERSHGRPVVPGSEDFATLSTRGGFDEDDWTYLRKDGGRVPVRLAVTPLRASSGEIQGFLGVAADVREQRRAAEVMRQSLEEKETMLREIHHRVKNNLQVVSSLLSLQGNASPHAEVKVEFAEARDRIRTMAMIHEQLYRSERLSTVNLLEHLRKLVQLQVTAYGNAQPPVVVEIIGEEATVSIDCAIPVGLIANELLSNAFKHGTRGASATRIEVQLRREEPKAYTLRVWNAATPDAGVVTLDRDGALGLRLVRALLGQIDGQLAADFEHGVELSVRFSDTPSGTPRTASAE